MSTTPLTTATSATLTSSVAAITGTAQSSRTSSHAAPSASIQPLSTLFLSIPQDPPLRGEPCSICSRTICSARATTPRLSNCFAPSQSRIYSRVQFNRCVQRGGDLPAVRNGLAYAGGQVELHQRHLDCLIPDRFFAGLLDERNRLQPFLQADTPDNTLNLAQNFKPVQR